MKYQHKLGYIGPNKVQNCMCSDAFHCRQFIGQSHVCQTNLLFRIQRQRLLHERQIQGRWRSFNPCLNVICNGIGLLVRNSGHDTPPLSNISGLALHDDVELSCWTKFTSPIQWNKTWVFFFILELHQLDRLVQGLDKSVKVIEEVRWHGGCQVLLLHHYLAHYKNQFRVCLAATWRYTGHFR